MKMKFTMDIFTDDHAEAVTITLAKMPPVEGYKVKSVFTQVIASTIGSANNTSVRVSVISEPA